MHITSDDLLDALRSHGYRITNARRAICEVIASSHDEHLDAAEILARVQATGTSADQSTVYRTLETLETAGVLTHGHLGHRASVYHLADESPHQHLVCESCGRTIAVDARDVADWAASIRDRTGFEIEPTHFALTGLCAECAAENRASGSG